ncbi:MAG: ABC transporter permease [Chloroflexia bacterium]
MGGHTQTTGREIAAPVKMAGGRPQRPQAHGRAGFVALLGRLDTLAAASLIFIVLMIVLAVIGPPIYQRLAPPNLEEYHTYYFQDYENINSWPSTLHWLGTDSLGRDTLARLMAGLRVSLLVAAFVQVVNVGLGASLGLLAGHFGGWIDAVVSRVADMLFAFPGLLLAILVSAVFGAWAQEAAGDIGRLLLVAGSLALVSWPLMARYVRSQSLSLREREFVLAAKSIGADDLEVMARHILPNVAGLIVTAATLDVASVILNEAVMSLLGLGIQTQGSSLGRMIVQAIPELHNNPFQVLVPSAVLTLLVLAFSFLGDGISDALNPQTR